MQISVDGRTVSNISYQEDVNKTTAYLIIRRHLSELTVIINYLVVTPSITCLCFCMQDLQDCH